MKLRIASILPKRWEAESAWIRGFFFTLIILAVSFAVESAYALGKGKAFLLSAFVAILVIYWVPPLPKETYVHWTVTHLVILFGAYLFLFKIPALFSGYLGYRLAQVLCISLYSVCCWFLMSRDEKKDTT
ncbi:MAG TPA: hypothetical protein VF708_05625 [Pyrinomonadaceae bacterium]|jgi:hypothetical protein